MKKLNGTNKEVVEMELIVCRCILENIEESDIVSNGRHTKIFINIG